MHLQPAKSVSALYAQIQAYKALWGSSKPNDQAFEHYLDLGRSADDNLFETRAQGLPEVLLKLTELLEWISNDAPPAQISLLSSAIADLDRFMGGEALLSLPTPKPSPIANRVSLEQLQAEAPRTWAELEERKLALRAAAYKRKPAKPGRKRVPVKTIGEINFPANWRPVQIKGTLYPSIQAASHATGIPYDDVRKMAIA